MNNNCLSYNRNKHKKQTETKTNFENADKQTNKEGQHRGEG